MKFHSTDFLLFGDLFLILAYLDFTYSLTITQERATKNINQTFLVICKDENGQAVQWKGPHGPLGPRTRPKMTTASYGTSIIFESVVPSDAGVYVCSSHTDRKYFNLTVTEPLTFMDTPQEQYGVEGSNVTLRCEVKGGKATWSFDGDDTNDERFSILGDGLSIINVNRTDSKTYVCRAVQESTGIVNERKIKLVVQHQPSLKPQVYAEQDQVFGYLGSTLNLTCEVEAEPPPKFEWFKRNRKLHKSGNVGLLFNPNPRTSVLQLYVQKSTFSDYKCIATNHLGTLEKYFTVAEGSKPPRPLLVELEEAYSDKLALKIFDDNTTDPLPEAMEIVGYRIEYRDVVNESDWYNQEFDKSEDEIYVLKDLQSETEYEVRAAARNLAGLSDYSNSSNFVTLEPDPNGAQLATGTPSLVVVVLANLLLIYILRP